MTMSSIILNLPIFVIYSHLWQETNQSPTVVVYFNTYLSIVAKWPVIFWVTKNDFQQWRPLCNNKQKILRLEKASWMLSFHFVQVALSSLSISGSIIIIFESSSHSEWKKTDGNEGNRCQESFEYCLYPMTHILQFLLRHRVSDSECLRTWSCWYFAIFDPTWPGFIYSLQLTTDESIDKNCWWLAGWSDECDNNNTQHMQMNKNSKTSLLLSIFAFNDRVYFIIISRPASHFLSCFWH